MIDVFTLAATLLNIGLVLINLGILGIGVKLYTDQRKQSLLKGIKR